MFGFFKNVKEGADVYNVFETATFNMVGNRKAKMNRQIVDSVFNEVTDRQAQM